MKNSCHSVIYAIAIGVCLVLPQGSATSGEPPPDEQPMVDFRMTPLEQAKKIHKMASSRTRSGVTMTVMTRGCGDGTEDRSHLIVDETTATRSYLQSRLFQADTHSVSWSPIRYRPNGACDSQSECRKKVEELCKGAGHRGAQSLTVTVTTHSDGSKTCSGDCKGNGAIAFVTCNPS